MVGDVGGGAAATYSGGSASCKCLTALKVLQLLWSVCNSITAGGCQGYHASAPIGRKCLTRKAFTLLPLTSTILGSSYFVMFVQAVQAVSRPCVGWRVCGRSDEKVLGSLDPASREGGGGRKWVWACAVVGPSNT